MPTLRHPKHGSVDESLHLGSGIQLDRGCAGHATAFSSGKQRYNGHMGTSDNRPPHAAPVVRSYHEVQRRMPAIQALTR